MQTYRLIRPAAVIFCLAGIPAHAAQNDQLPTDLVALPDGAINLAVYALQSTLSGPWKEGLKQRSGEGSTNLYAIRLNKHFSVGKDGEYTIAPVMVLSALDIESDAKMLPSSLAVRQASGFGDLRLGAAFWFHKDHANREYASASIFSILPTGDYESKNQLNVGENRVKTVLSMGWMKQLGSGWVLDLIPEVAIFGDNTRYINNRRLSQDTAYAMTGILRYKASSNLHWYTSAQLNRGGAIQVNGVPISGAPENTRWAVGALLFTGEGSQVQLRYARDTSIENGYRNEGELALRWSTVFK